MERNTLLAIVLSVGVLVIYSAVQGIFFPPQPAQVSPPVTQPDQNQIDFTQLDLLQQNDQTLSDPGQQTSDTQQQDTLIPVDPNQQTIPVLQDPLTNLTVAPIFEPIQDDYLEVYFDLVPVIETDALRVEFSRNGGDIVSWKLLNHKDKGDPVEMVLPGSGPNASHAFTIALGQLGAQPLNDSFKITEFKPGELMVFSKDYKIPGQEILDEEPQVVTLRKRYEFRPNEYLFLLKITLEGKGFKNVFNFNGYAYTLSFGPQIGPVFDKPDDRYHYRHFMTFSNGSVIQANPNGGIITNNIPKWSAITGKYFTFMSYPISIYGNTGYHLEFIQKDIPHDSPDIGVPLESRMNILRPAGLWDGSRIEDTYSFYLGPKRQDELGIYNNSSNNGFGQRDMDLSEIARYSSIFSPIESILKWILMGLYAVVRNYGIAIIILTLIVKILFFPLTKKGSMATIRMQSVAPKIKELQAKYKDNKQKLNAEMAELYKKEGYNPLSGCLPMLLQLPIFFAMFNLFNNHFDLHGAMFIPGWIPDLSQAEYIVRLDFSIPILGSYLRLLPFIYVGSQLLYGKVTQVPNQQSTTQMKFMLFVMPIIFFFILYDMPSGLLIYWIFSNIFTLVQQVIINKYFLPKKQAADAVATSATASVFQKKKKK